MQEKKKSGPVCCGQNSRKLRFYRGVSYVALCLGIGGGLGWLGLENMAQAAICFLPDCQDKEIVVGPSGVEECLAAGYENSSSQVCPPNSNIEHCPENSSYIKCNLRQWCLDNGYTIVPDDCHVPEYADVQCPNGEVLYFQCKEDLAKACLEEDNDYVSECPVGWILDEDELCSYSELYGKCCNLCVDYPYEEDEIPQGYQKGESCLACGNVIKYKKELYDCAAEGFIRCDKGGQTGTEICWRGDEKWYRECCLPCDGFPYFADTIPEGYVQGESCDSCDGMKYKPKEGECASGYVWENNACVACDETCSVGNILYSDYTCSSCNVSGKTPIGVISYAKGTHRLAISLEQNSLVWNSNATYISGLPRYSSADVAFADFSGKNNTGLIVKTLGDSSDYAAGYCYNYETEGTSKHQWYLPAAGEMYESIYINKDLVKDAISVLKLTDLGTYYWYHSSSEFTDERLWQISPGYKIVGEKKERSTAVRCVLSFEDNGDGTANVCDEEYKYACDGEVYAGGSGVSCGEMYQSCKCTAGYEWNGEACCNQTCSVGNILYSDYTCSSCNVSGKTPIGVISYASGTHRLAISLVQTSLVWDSNATYISGLPKYSSADAAFADFSGKNNTSLIVKTLGDSSDYAAGYCYNYETEGTSKHQWYLPAAGEMYESIYINKDLVKDAISVLKLTDLGTYYWYHSSSEFTDERLWQISPGYKIVGEKKEWSTAVRCVLSFEDNGDGTANVCDEEYKYSCDGENMIGGGGISCGGLYQSCQCASGYSWSNGTCVLACDSTYKYTCSGANISGGSGTACGGKYQSCICKSPYTWSNGSCICSSSYQYACTGTGYSGGSGTACGGKYTACTCAQDYAWSGSACVLSCDSSYQYTCSGANITGGSGAPCGGKYTACTCSSPYTWSSGTCSCPSTYKYACTGTGYSGGSGAPCGGKYTACTCADGYEWKNGVCEQAVVCKVGHILNSDMTCSSSKVSGKTPIGVVSYVNGDTQLAINLVHRSMQWGGYGTDISGLTNITSSSTAKNDFSGKSNTSKIVSALGDKSSYAAGYCYNYTTTGTSKGDWYLPAAGELYASIMTNYSAVNNGIKAAGGKQLSSDYYYWSSSEYGSKYAWEVVAYYGGVGYGGKSNNNSVRCVLAF